MTLVRRRIKQAKVEGFYRLVQEPSLHGHCKTCLLVFPRIMRLLPEISGLGKGLDLAFQDPLLFSSALGPGSSIRKVCPDPGRIQSNRQAIGLRASIHWTL